MTVQLIGNVPLGIALPTLTGTINASLANLRSQLSAQLAIVTTLQASIQVAPNLTGALSFAADAAAALALNPGVSIQLTAQLTATLDLVLSLTAQIQILVDLTNALAAGVLVYVYDGTLGNMGSELDAYMKAGNTAGTALTSPALAVTLVATGPSARVALTANLKVT